MKAMKRIFLAGLFFSALPLLANSTTVNIFNSTFVHFGGGIQNDATLFQEHGNGRIVSCKLALPTPASPTKITAHLIVDSAGDPWDRAGSVYLQAPGHENIELLKFITGFGGRSDLVLDVTNLAPMLQGECDINVFIDTWVNPGWVVDFDLVYETDDSITPATWDHGVYFKWTLNNESVSQDTPDIKINIPTTQERIMLTYYASGHATDGTGGDEFESKYNRISIDGVDMIRYKPWRNDCRDFRDRNPKSGRWGDTWSSDFSRSGWCPGDIVHPMILDVTWFLQQGEHEISYLIENIRPKDASGEGYWRTSSFLTGWGDISQWKPTHMVLSGPENNAFQLGQSVSLRQDLVDNLGYTVIKTDENIEFYCEQDNALFSVDQKNWQPSLTLPIRYGSAMVWFKAEKAGVYQVRSRDVAGVIPAPDPVEIIMNSYEPNPDEDNLALAHIKAEADCECNPETEKAKFAVDGNLATKWCCNNGGEDWLAVTLPDSALLNYFIIRHAGAGEAPQGDPGYNDDSGMNTKDFSIQVADGQGGWTDIVSMVANPQTAEGDVTYHLLETPVSTNKVRLFITDQGGDNASRIYEFEIYSRDVTAIDVGSFAGGAPETFRLFQNYPNPFNSETEFEFFIPEFGQVTAGVINANGRVIKNLVNGQLPRGRQALQWDGTDRNNQPVGSGVYFISVRYTDGSGRSLSKSIKLMLVK